MWTRTYKIVHRFSFHTPTYPIRFTKVMRIPVAKRVCTTTAYEYVDIIVTKLYLQNKLQIPTARTPNPES